MNVRSNLDFQLTPTTVLTANLSGSHGMKQDTWGNDDWEYRIWQGVYGNPPDAMWPRYSDGTWGYYPLEPVGVVNSAAQLALGGIRKTTTTRINTDFTLSQDLGMLVKGLSAKATVSMDNVFVQEGGVDDRYHNANYKWINPDTGEVQWAEVLGGSQFDFNEGIKWNTVSDEMVNWKTRRKLFYQFQLNYGVTLGKHDITAMGLFSRDEVATGSEFPHYREDWVFRTTYDFSKKYFVEFNGAYNGSEKFGNNYRFAFFPSGAIGWMISEEPFMKSLRFLDMLKFRGSYGIVGDDNISQRWLYMTQWSYGGATAPLGENAYESSPYTWYKESSIGNPEVHWGKVKKTNVGADFSFLGGLVAGSVDVFNDYRTDILVDGNNRATPSYYGAQTPIANLGRVRVKGYEIDLRLNYKFNNGLRVYANGNMTHSKDKILDTDDPELLPDYQKQAGKQIGQTYSIVNQGYYNTWDEVYSSTIVNAHDSEKLPGNYYLLDYNGDGVIDNYDRVPYGYPERPQNTYNATIGFEYKGFSAFVQFYGVNNVTRQVVLNNFAGNRNAVYDQGSYWTRYNTDADSPLPRWNSNVYDAGDFYMYDGSYIRLKNAEIAYTFESGWVKKPVYNRCAFT